MHLKSINLNPEKYPTHEFYPFNLTIFQQTKCLDFHSPVTFFCGENGTGKSTLLRAISQKCKIHIWENFQTMRFVNNPYEDQLHEAVEVNWVDGEVPGSFFSSQIFHNFAQFLDEWAVADSQILNYFGGKSLMIQSHGQSLLSFFAARYQIKGLYLMDEPETALSPKSQIELLKILFQMSQKGHAQFIIATHSPVLLSCPGAAIFSFDKAPIQPVEYEQTEYFQFYQDFMNHREKYFQSFYQSKGEFA
jgi:predicted ATPase